ncbi:MAG: prepilin-type N-terminal cleavage/methylation domain-containing protein [Candidatus Tantalella remota]|nr:prepilin-type N-terminal cleavage/methylation domain-containing protein [Candidatus Tantalella remota]
MFLSIRDMKGLSLVECLVAMAIVTIVATSLIAAAALSVSFTRQADSIYEASTLSQRRIDMLKKFPFSDLPNIAPETDTPLDTDGDGKTDFYRTTEITENYASNAMLMKIKVSVDRVKDGAKAGHPVVMETLLADIQQ